MLLIAEDFLKAMKHASYLLKFRNVGLWKVSLQINCKKSKYLENAIVKNSMYVFYKISYNPTWLA